MASYMKALRSLALSFLLAAAVVLGQQVATLHELSHATEQLSKKGGKTTPQACELCAMCANLTGAPGHSVPSVAPAQCTHERVIAECNEALSSQPLLHFRSRAPPTLI